MRFGSEQSRYARLDNGAVSLQRGVPPLISLRCPHGAPVVDTERPRTFSPGPFYFFGALFRSASVATRRIQAERVSPSLSAAAWICSSSSVVTLTWSKRLAGIGGDQIKVVGKHGLAVVVIEERNASVIVELDLCG